MILLAVSFIAGILTILAPCVLPLLPVIVGGSIAGGGKHRAFVISISLGASVFLFTLLLKASSLLISVPPAFWQYVSAAILLFFGIALIFPRVWDSIPLVNKLNIGANKALASGYQRSSLAGDILMGAALGPVFASCSPTYFIILATVLPASFAMGIADLLAYVIGLSGFLLVIALAGQKLVDKLGVTIEPGGWFRRSLGALFIVLSLLIATGVMQRIEAYLLDKGFDATRLEHRLLGAEPMAAATDLEMGFIPESAKAAMYKKALELVSPDGYINTGGERITLEELRAEHKVVLLDIWTYSCINCQRTLPYIKDWYEKYNDDGLVIIGVHTPEFAFEKVQANVERAVHDFGIMYPVVLDNEYQTWTAYGNQYWPRKYLIDIDGFIVYDHIGEGGYAETEAQIQRALHERAVRLGMQVEDMPAPTAEEEERIVRSPEVYFGAWRNEYLGNGDPFVEGEQTFTLPQKTDANTLYFGGTWDLEHEYARSVSKNAKIRFLYGAKDVYFVASADTPVKLRITRDGGKPLGADRGADVSADGIVTVQEERLYKLIEGDGYGEHTIEIEVLTPGLKAYTFTFG